MAKLKTQLGDKRCIAENTDHIMLQVLSRT